MYFYISFNLPIKEITLLLRVGGLNGRGGGDGAGRVMLMGNPPQGNIQTGNKGFLEYLEVSSSRLLLLMEIGFLVAFACLFACLILFQNEPQCNDKVINFDVRRIWIHIHQVLAQ